MEEISDYRSQPNSINVGFRAFDEGKRSAKIFPEGKIDQQQNRISIERTEDTSNVFQQR